MKKFSLTIFASLLSFSRICFGMQPCPEGTSPSKLVTVTPAVVALSIGAVLIWLIQKKVQNTIVRVNLQLGVGLVFLAAALLLFGFLSMIAPCLQY